MKQNYTLEVEITGDNAKDAMLTKGLDKMDGLISDTLYSITDKYNTAILSALMTQELKLKFTLTKV